jgi:hypothetical protein
MENIPCLLGNSRFACLDILRLRGENTYLTAPLQQRDALSQRHQTGPRTVVSVTPPATTLLRSTAPSIALLYELIL